MKFDKPHFEFTRGGYFWTPFVDVYWGKCSYPYRVEFLILNNSFGFGKCKK